MSAEDVMVNRGVGSIHVSSANIGSGPRVRLYESRPGFDERINQLVSKLDGFFIYNPEYSQTGLIQIAVSAKFDVGCYRVGEKEYLDDLIISKTPQDGTKIYVANLDEVRRRAGAIRLSKRCHYSRTYFLEENNGKMQATMLFENNDWLDAKKIEEAFQKLLWIKTGRHGNLEDVPMPKASAENWYQFSYGRLKDVGYVRHYEFEGEKRVLVAMVNSGTILDVEAQEIVLEKKAKDIKSGSEFSNSVLRFKFMSDTILCRCKGL